MFVVKRDGRKESVKFDKITARIEKLCYGFNLVDPIDVAKKVIEGLFDGVTTPNWITLLLRQQHR
jgi:ribonucleoside-diphosphate reductase alpha chain